MEICPIHGLTEFSIHSDGKKICKKCDNDSFKKTRRNYKKKLVEYKGGKCEICGYDKCISALEFHHLNPEEKEFEISNSKIYNFDKMKKEADKCILVCSNCHREIHHRIEEEKLREEEERKKQLIQEFYKNINRDTSHRVKESYKFLYKEKVVELISKGLSKQDIIKILKISYKTLNKFFEENNITYNKKNVSLKPSKEELKILIKEKSMVKIGKMYGVSDNSVRKWCKKYDLPYTKKDIKNMI